MVVKQRPEQVDDATLEFAARLIEDPSLLDLRGVAARRKRDREDAEVRRLAREEMRREAAELIRSMKSRRDQDAGVILARLATMDAKNHAYYLRDAWPLAWKGWVQIDATICCTSNHIPPETSYRITLTERGQEVLASRPTTPDT